MYQASYSIMKKLQQLKQANESDFFTVDEAAKELGIKPTAIRNYLTWDKLTTYKFKTLTLVHRNEVMEWKKKQK